MEDTWFQILVIIISMLTIVLLIIAITVSVLVFKITSQAKKLIDQTGQIADNAEKVVAGFAKSATPLAILKFVYKMQKDYKKGK